MGSPHATTAATAVEAVADGMAGGIHTPALRLEALLGLVATNSIALGLEAGHLGGGQPQGLLLTLGEGAGCRDSKQKSVSC